jgi:IS30 family transposase
VQQPHFHPTYSALKSRSPAQPPPHPQRKQVEMPEELNQRWQAFIQKLKERSPVGGRNLEGSQLQIEGDTIYLYLRSEMARAYFRESPQREQRLVEMVRQQLKDAERQGTAPSAAQQRSPAATTPNPTCVGRRGAGGSRQARTQRLRSTTQTM